MTPHTLSFGLRTFVWSHSGWAVFGGDQAARWYGTTHGMVGRHGERGLRRGACHGENSGQRWAEVSGRWLSLFSLVRALSLTYTPGLNQRGAGGGRGNIGCGWVHSTSPGDHQRRATCLPSCLSECRSVSSITDKGLFFNETTQTRAHVYGHRQHTHIQKYTWIKTCYGK